MDAKERRKKNVKKVWGKTYVRAYWPNFYRWEEIDNDKACYVIYLNDEAVEYCLLNATREEVDMRFHELLDEKWIKDHEMYVRKKFNE